MKNMDINLSEIEIIPVRPQKGLVAFCSFIINNTFCANDVGIRARMDGSGYLLTYPRKVLSNGKEVGLFYPIKKDVAQAIEDQVVKAFLELQAKAATMRHKENG